MIKKFEGYRLNENNSEYRNIIKEKFLKLFYDKNWFLYDKSFQDLGLRKIIDDFLLPISTKIDGNKDEKYQYAMSLLYGKEKLIEKFGDKYYCYKLRSNMVMENGEWSYLNKLNTNIYALIDILSDFFEYLYFKYCKTDNRKFSDIDPYGEEDWEHNDESIPDFYLNGIVGILEADIYNFKIIVSSYVKWNDKTSGTGIKDYLEENFKDKYSLSKYTGVIISNSEKGEKSEKCVADFLEKKGSKILYRGGNGDLIDMVFGCDLIIEKSGRIFTVQVKSYSLEYLDLSKQYDNVDIIIGVDKNNNISMFYDNKMSYYKL